MSQLPSDLIARARRAMTARLFAALSVASLAACQGDDPAPAADDEEVCSGAKCDDPEGETTGGSTGFVDTDEDGSSTGWGETDGFGDICAFDDRFDPDQGLEQCADRADTAFNPNRGSFQPDALRWSCADTPGRAPDNRGQEYCEYFVIAHPPTADAPSLHGHNGLDGGASPAVDLTPEDIEALDADPFTVAASCIFTTWNSDLPLPDGATPEPVAGIEVTADVFRMTADVNSRDAADLLVDQCMSCPRVGGDPDDPDDPLHDDFTRGCFLNGEINTTTDRKSDSIICAAAGRMGECGCQLANPAEGQTIGKVVARDDLGFPLGTWSGDSALPTGCRYHRLGTNEQNIVVCDIFAHQLVTHASEIKSLCTSLYADDVVVHVPIPGDGLVCDSAGTSASSKACGDTPWVVER